MYCSFFFHSWFYSSFWSWWYLVCVFFQAFLYLFLEIDGFTFFFQAFCLNTFEIDGFRVVSFKPSFTHCFSLMDLFVFPWLYLLWAKVTCFLWPPDAVQFAPHQCVRSQAAVCKSALQGISQAERTTWKVKFHWAGRKNNIIKCYNYHDEDGFLLGAVDHQVAMRIKYVSDTKCT